MGFSPEINHPAFGVSRFQETPSLPLQTALKTPNLRHIFPMKSHDSSRIFPWPPHENLVLTSIYFSHSNSAIHPHSPHEPPVFWTSDSQQAPFPRLDGKVSRDVKSRPKPSRDVSSREGTSTVARVAGALVRPTCAVVAEVRSAWPASNGMLTLVTPMNVVNG